MHGEHMLNKVEVSGYPVKLTLKHADFNIKWSKRNMLMSKTSWGSIFWSLGWLGLRCAKSRELPHKPQCFQLAIDHIVDMKLFWRAF
jgi:hypothetical protein